MLIRGALTATSVVRWLWRLQRQHTPFLVCLSVCNYEYESAITILANDEFEG